MKNIKACIAVVVGLFAHIQLHGDIVLKAYDEYGQATTTFHVGVPWTLEVALQDMADVKERPTVKGLDKAYARDSSMMTMSINGKTTIKYSYKVRFDASGAYTVGPATIERNGKTYTSNTISVDVVDQPTDIPDTKNKNTSLPLFVRMKVDKDRVVVGEKFKCTLRCYYSDQINQFAPASTMQFPGFIFDDGAQEVDGAETIKGVNYKYFELSWNVHATEAGKKTIPAYGVDYIVSANPYGSRASAIAMMFGHSFGEKKRAYSNAVPMIVDELPPHKGPVHAIGSFTHFAAKLDPLVAKQGEGMVLTLEAIGQGVFDKDHGIELQGMPSQLKYYDSKQYNDKADSSKKYFEFIVQAIEHGTWQIPSQQLTFFDTKTRAYKTLQTNPITVKILPYVIASGAVNNISIDVSSEVIGALDEIKPFMAQEDTLYQSELALPWWLMIMLIIFPLTFVGYERLKNSTIINTFGGRSRKNSAFNVARAQIKDVCAQQHISSLYAIFVRLFALRCNVNEHVVNQEFVYDVLKKRGMHEQELDQWNQFYNQLSELTFFNKHIKPSEYAAVQQYAYYWIDRLEKVL